MSATDHLTSSEIAAWRILVGATRVALDRPSLQAFQVLKIAAKRANKCPMPAKNDELGMRLFHGLVKAGLNWWAWSDEERGASADALRDGVEACAVILGPEPLPAPVIPAPEPRKPYYLEDDE